METTTATGETYAELIAQCNDLIALDYDAVAAYAAAIERIDDPSFRTALAGYKADHERHIQELQHAVSSLGGRVRERGDLKMALTRGKVIFANLMGDKAILKAMRSNEDTTNAKYEGAVAENMGKAPAWVMQILQRGLNDERRHHAWLSETLARLS